MESRRLDKNVRSMVGVYYLALLVLTLNSARALEIYQANVPNGGNVPGFARLGHVTESLGNNNLNPFGVLFRSEGFTWTATVCRADSDGDGFTNGYELGDPDCQWSQQNPTPLRTVGLTHPGLRSSFPPPISTTQPTLQPTTLRPTSKAPTSNAPTSKAPTSLSPTLAPTTSSPTAPTAPVAPTPPTLSPTNIPTNRPTSMPSSTPSTSIPTISPIGTPSAAPTAIPSPSPSFSDPFGSGGEASIFPSEYEVKLWIGHAVLMSLAFGLFLPIGIVIPAIPSLRAKPGGVWLKYHLAFQGLFILLAWIGFLIALFAVAMGKQTLSGVLDTTISVHGPFGVSLMVLLSVQGLMGIFRPHLPHEPGQLKSTVRLVFEFVHPWFGRSLLILGVVQMYLGLNFWNEIWATSVAQQESIQAWAYFQVIFTPIAVAFIVGYFKFATYRNSRQLRTKPPSQFDNLDRKRMEENPSTPSVEDPGGKTADHLPDANGTRQVHLA